MIILKNRATILALVVMTIVLSGCLQAPQEKEPTATTPTPEPVLTTERPPETSVATPVPTQKILPSNTLFVRAYMLRPINWGSGKYEVRSLKVEVFNQVNDPVSIKALIMNSGQVLEETYFSIGGAGGSYQFSNQKQYFINGTNVTLRLIVGDYQPVDYEIKETENLN